MKNTHIKRVDLIFEKVTCREIANKVFKKKPVQILQEILESGLKGRGGAGFPTGMKWKFAAEEKSTIKYIICNADEGEPGTFKDRQILTDVPEKVFCFEA